MTTVLLIHGGLWEDMDADRFWARPGILAGLRERGCDVLAPDRLPRAVSWIAEADHLAGVLPADQPVAVVAGSYGCSAAVRLAVAHPQRVRRLLLAWPATAGDEVVDTRLRAGLAGLGASAKAIDGLLAGETLLGVTDDELRALSCPVGVLPSMPDNPVHQRRTVDRLLRVIPGARELPGYPEPPRPEFAPYVGRFVATVARFIQV